MTVASFRDHILCDTSKYLCFFMLGCIPGLRIKLFSFTYKTKTGKLSTCARLITNLGHLFCFVLTDVLNFVLIR